MYLARFAYQDIQFVSAAFRWPQPDGAVLTREWTRALLAQKTFDLALRIEVGTSGCSNLLLVNTHTATERELWDFSGKLLQTHAPSGVVIPSTAQEFDALTGGLPSTQIRVNHSGYHHYGKPLACDFRLYTMLARHDDAASTIYQVHLRPHLPNAEIERRVRKYMAWLDIEKPFNTPVRAMQRMLTLRLCQRGFLASEYLATQDSDGLEQWRKRIRTHFEQTIGRIGFPEAPIETGDFTDFLTIGYHPTRVDDTEPDIPRLGATVFSDEETAFLLSSNGAFGRKTEVTHGATGIRPDVFISYASSDYAHAAATCCKLEESGIVCWIAPRDINRDILPYPEAIQRGISEARAVVVFLSDAANLSVHIPRELDLALERKLAIIPVRLADIAPAGQLNYLLRTCQRLDACGRDFNATMEELIGRLRMLLG